MATRGRARRTTITSFETAIVVTGPEMDATNRQSFSVLGLFQYIAEPKLQNFQTLVLAKPAAKCHPTSTP